jgi:ribonuclease H2 subunit A
MVYGLAYCPVSRIQDIEALGVADSKQLKESDREEILGKIHENSEFVGYCVTVLSPNYLSTSMLGRENYNLNAISHDTAISLLRRIIAKGVKVGFYLESVKSLKMRNANAIVDYLSIKLSINFRIPA